VARAVRVLLESGISGPFGLALSSDIWTTVVESTEHGGYPLFEHLRKAIVGGLSCGRLVSKGGGPVAARWRLPLREREDISIGYLHHDRAHVTLYLEESFTFKVDTRTLRFPWRWNDRFFRQARPHDA